MPQLALPPAHDEAAAVAGPEGNGRLQPDLEGLSPDAAWGMLLQTAQQHPANQHGSRLYLAAVQAALAKERRLKLPAPLLAPFQVISCLPALSKASHGERSRKSCRSTCPAHSTHSASLLHGASGEHDTAAVLQASAVQQAAGGMAGRAADPAALLALYIRYDRLADAANLVTSHLAAYQKVAIRQLLSVYL